MTAIRIALANVRYPATPDESVSLATRAIADAGAAGADIICFPECFIPGYRGMGHTPPPPDAAFLEGAWSAVAAAAREANVAVVVGTERLLGDRLVISTLVVNRDGSVAGWQDKVQLDPSEEGPYVAGAGRHLFPSRRRFGRFRPGSATTIPTRSTARHRVTASRDAVATIS